jgi:diamine N-acetyltransferase
MREIRPVTKDNWQALIQLKVRGDQQHFVASNLYCIAEAQFGFDYEGHWDFHPFGIFDESKPVGCFVYGSNFEHSERQAFIIHLMVDEKSQGKGYGRFGVEKMLEMFRLDERIKVVAISYFPENNDARKLYASFGFVETGKILEGELEGEVEAVLQLR